MQQRFDNYLTQSGALLDTSFEVGKILTQSSLNCLTTLTVKSLLQYLTWTTVNVTANTYWAGLWYISVFRFGINLVYIFFNLVYVALRNLATLKVSRSCSAEEQSIFDRETVAEALLDMYSRVGVPEEVLSDLGTQFTSDCMKEVSRLLPIRRLTTSLAIRLATD